MQKILFIILLLLQTSCGFTPVYKMSSQNGISILASIEIAPINTIAGTYFYNHLNSILPPKKNVKYLLTTNLSFDNSYSVIQKNSDILRKIDIVSVDYKLVDKTSLKIIIDGNFRKINSYSDNFSLYSNATIKEDSVNLLAKSAAEELRNRLFMTLAAKSSIN